MKNTYCVKLSPIALAVADLSRIDSKNTAVPGPGWLIHRINVPKKFRGCGHGSELLKTIIKDADQENQILYLEISPCGGLDFSQLKSWYEKYGFEDIGNEVYMREPDPKIRTKFASEKHGCHGGEGATL